jgi:hypothetical protein
MAIATLTRFGEHGCREHAHARILSCTAW